MKKLIKRFDLWLDSHLFLLIALILLLVLRLPNLFEPYWYGDEGIYLTLGKAIRDGERLYTDIVDHKTPIIYYLAAVPSQLHFRLLTIGWMVIATTAFYAIAQKFFKKNLPLIIATFTFVILTTVPWFEGNIPNGELFVMGFILVGGWLLTKTQLFKAFMDPKKKLVGVVNRWQLFLAGVFFGLAILTKVPAIFDVAAWLAVGWFVLTNRFAGLSKKKSWFKLLKIVAAQLLVIGIGVLLPILVSIVYFVAIGSGHDYLQFGLLYNFRYAAHWGLPFSNLILEKFFTLPGKVLIAGLIYAVLTLRKKWFKPGFQLIAGWFILELVGALLSNRPYPHYFQQLMPAFAFTLGFLVQTLTDKKFFKLPQLTMIGILNGLFVASLVLLDFGAYATLDYYQKSWQLVTGKISYEHYRDSFSHFMPDNYLAANIITAAKVDEIFIWGTNPMLYALSNTQPTGQFTVSFHIKDFDAYQDTMESIKAKAPLFIVVMADETTPLPGLDEYLDEFYVPNSNFTNFILWKRLPKTVSVW